MDVITIANHKGGVGKTTTTVNLAAGLARQGHRTLLLDCDAQAHSTHWFAEEGEDLLDLRDVISGGEPVSKARRSTRIEGLDLVASSLLVARLELDMVAMVRREDRIAQALAEVADEYDYVVIDTAPSLSVLTLAALSAADYLITPIEPTVLAAKGLSVFLDWSEDLRDMGALKAPLLGVLVTKVDLRTNITKDVLASVHSGGLPTFATTIPMRTRAEDQVGMRLVTGDPGANPDLDRAYRELTLEVLAAIKAHPRG